MLSTSGDTHLGGDDFDKVSLRFTFKKLCWDFFFLFLIGYRESLTG